MTEHLDEAERGLRELTDTSNFGRTHDDAINFTVSKITEIVAHVVVHLRSHPATVSPCPHQIQSFVQHHMRCDSCGLSLPVPHVTPASLDSSANPIADAVERTDEELLAFEKSARLTPQGNYAGGSAIRRALYDLGRSDAYPTP